MASSIVIPLDGSERAETALEPGLALATGFGSELVLVRATWHRPPDEEQQYLDGVIAKLGYEPARAITVHGFADSEIADLLATMGQATLCLATHGETGLGASILGSVAREIIDRSLGRPIVLVGPGYTGTSIGERAGGTLVYCYDGAPTSAELETTVAHWADRLGLAVRVVTVLHRDEEFIGGIAADDVRVSAEEVVERLQARGLSAHGAVLAGLDAARAIAEDSATHDVALTAMGATASARSKGLARLSRSVLGSTSQRVVRHASAPVLILRG